MRTMYDYSFCAWRILKGLDYMSDNKLQRSYNRCLIYILYIP